MTTETLRPLTTGELAEITGIKTKHKKLPADEVYGFLRGVGIWCWMGKDGCVKTTWHHVFSAGTTTQEPQRFGAADLGKVK